MPQKAFWHKLFAFAMTVLFVVAFGVVLAGLVRQFDIVAGEFERMDREKAEEEGRPAEPEPAPSLVPMTE